MSTNEKTISEKIIAENVAEVFRDRTSTVNASYVPPSLNYLSISPLKYLCGISSFDNNTLRTPEFPRLLYEPYQGTSRTAFAELYIENQKSNITCSYVTFFERLGFQVNSTNTDAISVSQGLLAQLAQALHVPTNELEIDLLDSTRKFRIFFMTERAKNNFDNFIFELYNIKMGNNFLSNETKGFIKKAFMSEVNTFCHQFIASSTKATTIINAVDHHFNMSFGVNNTNTHTVNQTNTNTNKMN